MYYLLLYTIYYYILSTHFLHLHFKFTFTFTFYEPRMLPVIFVTFVIA